MAQNLDWVYNGMDAEGRLVVIRLPYNRESIADVAGSISAAVKALGYSVLTCESLTTALTE